MSYIFVHDGSNWHHSFQTIRELYPDNVDRDSKFAVSDDLMVIGLPNMIHTATSTQGSAEVYSSVSGQWVLQDVLFQSPDAAQGQFGNSIAVYEDIIVVSNRRGGGRNEGSHSAEVFQHTSAGWQRVIELRAGDPSYDATFTYDAWLPFTPSSATIAVWESTVAVGAGHSEVLPPGLYISILRAGLK